MTHEVVRRVAGIAGEVAATAQETERLGRLADESVKLVRAAGVVRLLQPAEYGGYEAHPRDCAEAVMKLAAQCGSTGWVGSVAAVHAWETALMDRRLQDEVWGPGPDTWISSAYAPQGVAVPADGGYVLRGRWNFSSGSDHCDWVVLGALVAGADGRAAQPARMLHVVVPRADFTVVDGTWDVIGLCGTGSKDVTVEDAFVPAYRTLDPADVVDGTAAAERAGRTGALYRLPFWAMLPLGITAPVIGICEGALAAHLAYQRDRVSPSAPRPADDPYVLYAVSEAAAEIAASRSQLLDGISRLYDLAGTGRPITFADRAAFRRDQTRSAWRAVTALDTVFARSGGNAVRRHNIMQRHWRDAHVGLQHAAHIPGTIYHATTLTTMNITPSTPLRPTI
ncbi:acyl-CoA dehydrogenase family protein [Streptomyces acidicola]|uniref:hydroxylase n=1 Tax=Streptomyces acidicola TaxID=2596892 RepID=UPI0038268603